MVNESVGVGSTGNPDFDGTRLSSESQNSEESEGCRRWPLFVRRVVSGNGELRMRCRFAKEVPALSGEEI
jgi:hypothetical protein